MLPANRPPTHPGEMLREEFLKPLKITQEQLAEMLGVTFQTVSRIINAHHGVSPNMAARLARLFGTTPEFWTGLQQDWELWHELRGARAEIERIQPLPTARPARTGGGGGAYAGAIEFASAARAPGGIRYSRVRGRGRASSTRTRRRSAPASHRPAVSKRRRRSKKS